MNPSQMPPFLRTIDDWMRHIVDETPPAPEFDTMLRYALGWVDANGNPDLQPTGKRIRPLLLTLCAQAVGGAWQDALPAAAAVELLHNFSLIHDDIQDESPMRRNRPTVWRVWGRANAINAGDAMFALAYTALHRLSSERVLPDIALECWAIFNRTNLELTRGQHLDMRFEKQAVVSVEDYITMIDGKSASLIAASAQMGALIGSKEKLTAEATARHYADFGRQLGIAFQIHDDLLDIWGDPSVTGKIAANDIHSRKKSLPVLYGLANCPELVALYGRETFTNEDVAEAVRLLDSVGTLDYTRQREAIYYQNALDSLQKVANPDSQGVEALLTLVDTLFKRES